MYKLQVWFKTRVLIPVLTRYQEFLGRIIEYRRKKMDRRYDSFNQTEPDFQGEDYQYLLKRSQTMDRLTLHELKVEKKLEALEGGQVMLLPTWGGEEDGEQRASGR